MIFKKKHYAVNDEPIPYDIPATYGEEYDEYDYFYTKIPNDTQKWQWWYEQCNSCGKYHRRNFVSTHYFYTLDGYDSMSYTECWKCMLTSKVRSWWLKRRREKEKQKEFKRIIKSMNITKEEAAIIKKVLYNK